ncbi:MAG: hypothetical protein C0601_07910 [Candidatus Muiribacterium halophilum]|uniref:ABC1 atypical kinase-like domain-containing protein n=1 Tax=Muiribacterium halophilum TaxID=2053465 RepID=A0A2N5ZF14_MUIH1|nr:MAG: hypothetical protein C0601_07910 [Candidatus Muirbacterium halophilum]
MFRRLREINNTYKNLSRLKEITSVFIKYGFKDLVKTLDLNPFSNDKTEEAEANGATGSRAKRIRKAFEELGTTFIKLGQFISTRPDIFSEDIINELKGLQHDVKPFPSDEAIKVLEYELGGKIGEFFRDFDEIPVSSASIAQVHRGVLKNGAVVAIKIQRPNIKEKIRADLEIMFFLSTIIKKYFTEYDFIQPEALVEDMSDRLIKELDFYNEINNIRRFIDIYEKDENVVIPKVYREFSTEKVIVMEYIEGEKLSSYIELEKDIKARKEIARIGADAMLKQVFEAGFFHGDPHAGNIFVLANDRIAILDHGICASLTLRQKDLLENILKGVLDKDEKLITNNLLEYCELEHPDVQTLEEDVRSIIDDYAYIPLSEISMQDFFVDFSKILRRNRIFLSPDFFLLLRALVSVEGSGRLLYPDFDLISHARPFVKDYMWRKINPKTIGKQFYRAFSEAGILLKDLPSDLRLVINRLKKGKVLLEFEIKEQDRIVKLLDDISNRMVFSIILASIILGSSIIVLSGIPPKWNDIPVIGIAGYIVAGLMGFYILFSIWRER